MAKKSVCVLIILLLLGLMIQPVSAAETIVPAADSEVFLSYGSGIGYDNGYISCQGFSNLLDYYYQSITVELQKYNGSTWTQVDS